MSGPEIEKKDGPNVPCLAGGMQMCKVLNEVID